MKRTAALPTHPAAQSRPAHSHRRKTSRHAVTPPLGSLVSVLTGALLAGSGVLLTAAGHNVAPVPTDMVSGHPLAVGLSHAEGAPASPALSSPRRDAPQAPPAVVPQSVAPGATEPQAAAPADASTPARTIMIIRHAEKPTGQGLGIDAAGNPDAHSLTPRGWSRAKGIAGLFASPGGPGRPGLARPRTIFAAAANGQGEGTRTRETVGALAGRLGVPVNTSFGKGDEAALAQQAIAASKNGPVLISWQHGEIPAIAEAFSTVGPTPPAVWPDSRYDMVWTLTDTGHGWKFSQVPEMVLPGDSGQTFR